MMEVFRGLRVSFVVLNVFLKITSPYTLLQTNISPLKTILRMMFLFCFGGIWTRSLEGIYSICLLKCSPLEGKYPVILPLGHQKLGGSLPGTRSRTSDEHNSYSHGGYWRGHRNLDVAGGFGVFGTADYVSF